MKSKTIIIAINILLFGSMTFCDSLSRQNPRMPRISYVYLPALMEYLSKGDSAAKELKTQKALLNASIENIKTKLERGDTGIPEAVLRADLKKYENEMKSLYAQEEKIKAGYYRTIDSAIGVVARRLGVDFVFNRGEELLYAEKEHDITEKVIHELSSRKNRTSPHSR